MKLKVFSVFDSKIGTFARPFFMKTQGEALRGWLDVVNDERSAFSKHPEDFTLFEIGSFEDEEGRFENHVTPISLGLALEFVKKPATVDYLEREKMTRNDAFGTSPMENNK